MNTLIPLLGVDKSNPLLELLVNPEFPEEILVHYGMHLLEKVHHTGDSIEGKLLAGRLYNAKLKRKNLTEVFGWDLKTIRGYGEALRSGDADRLRSILSGQGAERKLGEKEERFIRETFREVHEEQGCHTNRFIQKQLLLKLGVEISRETVRRLINEEKERLLCQAEEISEAYAGGESTPLLFPASVALKKASGSVDIPEQTATSSAAGIGKSSNEKEKGNAKQGKKSEFSISGEKASARTLPALGVDPTTLPVKIQTSTPFEITVDETENEGEQKRKQEGESCSPKMEKSCNIEAPLSSDSLKKRKYSPFF